MSYPNPNAGYGYPSAPPSSSHPPYPYNHPPPPGPHSYGAPPQPGAAPQYGAPPQPGAPPQYGAPPQPGVPPQYGAPPQPGAPPQYGAPPQPGVPPQPDPPQYGAPPQPDPSQYGAPAPSAPPYTSEPYNPPKTNPHPTQSYGAHAPSPPYSQPASAYGGGYPPLAFTPGTDPNLIACFQMADRDGSGFIDDKELQTALSSYSQSFSIRTVHLLMYTFTNTNVRKIGPREFTSIFYSLQNWRSIFERFDRDRSGKIDASELREALLSLGFSVSPGVLDLLISKFNKSGGMNKAIEYDNFIECCITVKGLTEKFKEKDTSYTGSASFTYDAFMLTVLPFLIA